MQAPCRLGAEPWPSPSRGSRLESLSHSPPAHVQPGASVQGRLLLSSTPLHGRPALPLPPVSFLPACLRNEDLEGTCARLALLLSSPLNQDVRLGASARCCASRGLACPPSQCQGAGGLEEPAGRQAAQGREVGTVPAPHEAIVMAAGPWVLSSLPSSFVSLAQSCLLKAIRKSEEHSSIIFKSLWKRREWRGRNLLALQKKCLTPRGCRASGADAWVPQGHSSSKPHGSGRKGKP